MILGGAIVAVLAAGVGWHFSRVPWFCAAATALVSVLVLGPGLTDNRVSRWELVPWCIAGAFVGAYYEQRSDHG